MTIMSAQAKLRDLVEGMEMQPQEGEVYFDRQTGEIVLVTDDALGAVEAKGDGSELPGWHQALIQEAEEVLNAEEGRFVQLPDLWEAHELQMAGDYCGTLDAVGQADRLRAALRGREASRRFRRFMETVTELGITMQWYRFRNATLEQIAREWCEEHGIQVLKEGKEG